MTSKSKGTLYLICLLLLPLIAQGDGILTGDSGGNEKEVSLFDRDKGQVWHTVTGVSGRFTSKPLPAGEYLAVSGSRFSPIVIRDNEATELLFTSQAGMSADSETWSPSRKKFGQTFKATGPWVNSFKFWNPGKPVHLTAELRKDGPTGTLIGQQSLGPDKVSWIKIVDLQPDQWPTTPGSTYYLSLFSPSSDAFRIGTPAVGNPYPDGQAYYDDAPMLDSDLGLSISQDSDGLETMARVTLHQGFGFKSEGPASGSTSWAAQTFIATASNLRSAWINAGWPSAEGGTKRFLFSVHENSPEGKQVGPSRSVLMIKDWGATAVWFADQVPLKQGNRYAIKLAREDNKPFYAYLAPNLYKGGHAVRASLTTPDMDLTCSLRGERVRGSTVLPCNVRVAHVSATNASIEWETAIPTTTELQLTPSASTQTTTEGSHSLRHHVTVENLQPGRTYSYRVGGTTPRAKASLMQSKSREFTTLNDPRTLPNSDSLNAQTKGRPIPLVNPSFEDKLTGWTVSPKSETDYTPSLPHDVGNLRAVYYMGRYHAHSGKRALGWNHQVHENSGPIPRKIDPAMTRTVFQNVETKPGRTYVLSAWVCTDERQGGWNRNDRVRLIVDTTSKETLNRTTTVDEEFVTQWFTTRGKWRQFRLQFQATRESTAVGVQLYQWWLLAENHLYVDDIALIELSD